jgi:uncharacterized Fe-S cluster protein YjdI/CDGSH-type Zn-finger protein
MSPREQRTYETESIRVHWDSSRCIHTRICLRTLPSVFNVYRRPWVDLTGAEAPAAGDAVASCPSGALRFERLDGADGELPLRPTRVLPITDGPLLVAGELELRASHDEPGSRETRLTLCRCGLSHNQPFCDSSHAASGFRTSPADALRTRPHAATPPAFPATPQIPDPRTLDALGGA